MNPASVVQVNRNLEIPNKKARVYLQNGVETAKRDLESWSGSVDRNPEKEQDEDEHEGSGRREDDGDRAQASYGHAPTQPTRG